MSEWIINLKIIERMDGRMSETISKGMDEWVSEWVSEGKDDWNELVNKIMNEKMNGEWGTYEWSGLWINGLLKEYVNEVWGNELMSDRGIGWKNKRVSELMSGELIN